MEKITPQNIAEVPIKKETFFLNSFNLCANSFLEELNGEKVVLEQDPIDHEWEYLFLPDNIEGLEGKQFIFLTEKEIKKLEGTYQIFKKRLKDELYYKTKDLIELKGPEYSRFRKQIRRFQSKYNFKVLESYDKKKIEEFLEKWRKQRDIGKFDEKAKTIFEYINKLNKTYAGYVDEVPCYSIFIEVDNKLAAFRVATRLSDKVAAGVVQRVLYEYEGISRYLYHLTARALSEYEYITLGTGTYSEGIQKMKESLRPARIEPRFMAIVQKKK